MFLGSLFYPLTCGQVLDLILDSNLVFLRIHVSYTANKANKMVGFTKRKITNYSSFRVLCILYVTYIHPILNMHE